VEGVFEWPSHEQAAVNVNLLQGVLHASSISLKSLVGIAAHLPVVRIVGPGFPRRLQNADEESAAAI
jgi:hypothetical protein